MKINKFVVSLMAIVMTLLILLSGAVMAADDEVVIGVSNGHFGTTWRTQMINSIKTEFEEKKAAGYVDKLIVQNAGPDINKQIQQIRNMINSDVDVIMVNALSKSGLNGVLEEAHEAGVSVVNFDQVVSSPYPAVNISVDHYNWGYRYADWLAKALAGEGRIIAIQGFDGHPASEARVQAMENVFSEFPGIEVLVNTSGGWSQNKAQQVTSNLLASYSDIDGAFVQDSMGLGVLTAFEVSGKKIPTMTGDAMMGFLREWKRLREQGEETVFFAQANPPDIGASGFQIAVRIANGMELKPNDDNIIYYPIKTFIRNSNLDYYLQRYEDKPDNYYIATSFTDAEADSYFEGSLNDVK